MLGVTWFHSDLTSIRFCLANLLKMIPPPTLSAGLAFCRALGITPKMANQTTSITSFAFLVGFPSCADVQIVTPLIDSVNTLRFVSFYRKYSQLCFNIIHILQRPLRCGLSSDLGFPQVICVYVG